MVARTTSSGGRSTTGGSLGSVLDLGQEDLRAAAPGLEQLLADGRQADVVGGLDVVVADDREVVRHVEAELARRGDDAERLRVAGGEDRRRAVARVRASGGRGRAPRSGRGRRGRPTRRGISTPAARELARQARLAVPARGEAERVLDGVADEADRAVAEVEQVASRERAAGRRRRR